MQIQIDPNIPSNVPDEELRDFQSFIQTALDGLTAAAGGEVMALGTGLLTGLALIVIVIAGVKIAFSGNIHLLPARCLYLRRVPILRVGGRGRSNRR